MTTDYQKHRLSKEDFDVDFADQLGSSESLSGLPSVAVAKWVPGTGWTDVSSEFAITGQAVDGTKAVFFMGVAGSDQQEAGFYRVTVSCGTDAGETLHAEPSLFVRDTGDPAAP